MKLIGDEVMFVVTDPGAGCEMALELAVRPADHPRLPSARGGLAFGDVLSRDGDYFGPVVNLAARIVKLGAPGIMLASAGASRRGRRLRAHARSATASSRASTNASSSSSWRSATDGG